MKCVKFRLNISNIEQAFQRGKLRIRKKTSPKLKNNSFEINFVSKMKHIFLMLYLLIIFLKRAEGGD